MNCKLVWMNRADMKNRPHVSPIPGHGITQLKVNTYITM